MGKVRWCGWREWTVGISGSVGTLAATMTELDTNTQKIAA